MADGTKERRERIVGLMRELPTMPEKAVIDELRSLDVSIYIYKANHAQVTEFIDYLQNDPSNQDLWHMTSIQKSHAAHYELARLLQNHVASVKSLVDHTRQMAKRLYADGRFPDYQKMVDRVFKNNSLVQFVQCLRNILLHAGTAQLVFQTSLDPKSDFAINNFGLPTEYLRQHEGWFTSAAKRYLASVKTDAVDIPTLISEYDKKVNEFYGWLGQRQRELHAAELARYSAKEQEMCLLTIEDRLDGWLASPDPVANSAPSDRGLFLGLLDVSEFERIEELPEGSAERVELALALVKARLDVPAEMEANIRRAYADPNFHRFDLCRPKTIDEWNAAQDDEVEAE